MPTWKNEQKYAPFSEEDVEIISKANPCAIWTGTKVMYSGEYDAGPQQASGYNYGSGESDLEPYNQLSGFGHIRIPELNQLHKLFVFPKDPKYIARVDYLTLTLGTTSGLPSGTGGCSGKVALVHWLNICSGTPTVHSASGIDNISGDLADQFTSGVVDVIAFGSQF